MKKKKMRDVKIPWQHTQLDHWSEEVDPAVMASDRYVDENDVGFDRYENKELQEKLQKGGTMPPFMHPMHDATYGNE